MNNNEQQFSLFVRRHKEILIKLWLGFGSYQGKGYEHRCLVWVLVVWRHL